MTQGRMIRKIKYNSTWETEFDWLKPSKMSDYYALCTFCKQYFEVDGSGKSQVIRHSKSQRHVQIEKNRRKNNNLQTVTPQTNKSTTSNFSKLSKEEEVINAEIIWALKTIDTNYSFNGSSNNCSFIFKSMFPDSTIAKNIDMGRMKIRHLAQFGIAPHIEKIIKMDLQGSPFSFILDETTNSPLKKQFDVYVQYWSTAEDKFVPALYCGTVFVGHWRADSLKTNFFVFVKKLGLECSLLMQITMAGPNNNLKFHKLLMKELDELYFTSLLDIGTCSVHPVYTGLKKGLSQISFSYEQFLNDLVFFFKLSSVRKEDDKSLELVAEVLSKFFLGHTSSRWLFLKPALCKVLEQYRSIKDYFLSFLPKQENFKREIENTSKYRYITRMLKDRRTLIYINFVINAANIFEPLLINFLKREPLIHLLYDDLSSLLYDLMSNFLKHNVLVRNGKKLEGDRLNQIDCRNKNLHLPNVALSLSIKKEIGQSSLNAKVVSEIYDEFFQFYIESTTYLQKTLPLNSSFLKDIRHLHPLKRDADAIGRICRTVVNVIRNENILNRLFHTQGKDKNSLCDIVINQAKMYVLEKNLPSENIEDHWRHVGQLKNGFGEKKYLQLYVLAKCVIVLSHGNSASERGFAVNNNILERNSNALDEDSIVTIKMIKDYLTHIGGIEHFTVNREIIKTVKNSHKKYAEYLDRKNRKRKG